MLRMVFGRAGRVLPAVVSRGGRAASDGQRWDGGGRAVGALERRFGKVMEGVGGWESGLGRFWRVWEGGGGAGSSGGVGFAGAEVGWR